MGQREAPPSLRYLDLRRRKAFRCMPSRPAACAAGTFRSIACSTTVFFSMASCVSARLGGICFGFVSNPTPYTR